LAIFFSEERQNATVNVMDGSNTGSQNYHFHSQIIIILFCTQRL